MSESTAANQLLFEYEFPVRYLRTPPMLGEFEPWGQEYFLPDWGFLDDVDPKAQAQICWNESGLHLRCEAPWDVKKSKCHREEPRAGECMIVCVNTREGLDVKRADRFCRQFFFLPTGGGRNHSEPVAGVLALDRAKESGPPVAQEELAIASQVGDDAYLMEMHIPASCLHDFDPASHPRIRICAAIFGHLVGRQFFAVADDLHWSIDPSTWARAVLTPSAKKGRAGDKKAAGA